MSLKQYAPHLQLTFPENCRLCGKARVVIFLCLVGILWLALYQRPLLAVLFSLCLLVAFRNIPPSTKQISLVLGADRRVEFDGQKRVCASVVDLWGHAVQIRLTAAKMEEKTVQILICKHQLENSQWSALRRYLALEGLI